MLKGEKNNMEHFRLRMVIFYTVPQFHHKGAVKAMLLSRVSGDIFVSTQRLLVWMYSSRSSARPLL